MPYIYFTEEQKLRASEVDLVEFLRCQGEKLIRSGPEHRLDRDHSVTVRGNEWYDHSYPGAITCLLGGEQGVVYTAPHEVETVLNQEGIDTEIVHVDNKAIRGCTACFQCVKQHKCAIDDFVNEVTPKFRACDGIVVGPRSTSPRQTEP